MMKNLTTALVASTMMAGGALAAASTSSAATVASHTCNTVVSRTYSGVTYTAPTYKDAAGHYNACAIAAGTTNTTTVPALQKSLNTAIASLHLQGATKITTFDYFGPQTQADLKIFQKYWGLPQTGTLDANTDAQLMGPLGILA